MDWRRLEVAERQELADMSKAEIMAPLPGMDRY